MKRKIFIILLFSFLFIGRVNAEGSLTCTYGTSGSVEFSCSATDLTLTCYGNSVATQLHISATHDLSITDFIDDDNKYYCPEKIYCKVTSNSGGAFYSDFSFSQKDTSLSLSGSSGVGTLVDYAALDDTYCPLGADVTQDLYGALKIFKIVAPILCIALSIIEVIKAVAKGDAESELKPVFNRFTKRLVLTAILFFLPVLVDASMQLLNVWDSNGRCEFTDLKNRDLENSDVVKCYTCNTTGAYFWDKYKNVKSKCDGTIFVDEKVSEKSTCVAKTAACYKCGDGSYNWFTLDQANNKTFCPGTAEKTTYNKTLCSTGGNACWKCATKEAPDHKIYWYGLQSEDKGHCRYGVEGSVYTDIPESECTDEIQDTKNVEKCYRCEDGSYKWSTLFDVQYQNACKGSFEQTDISKADCNAGGIACYKCSKKEAANHKIFWWGLKSENKGNCNMGSAGAVYTKVPEAECTDDIQSREACFRCENGSQHWSTYYGIKYENVCNGGSFEEIDATYANCYKSS